MYIPEEQSRRSHRLVCLTLLLVEREWVGGLMLRSSLYSSLLSSLFSLYYFLAFSLCVFDRDCFYLGWLNVWRLSCLLERQSVKCVFIGSIWDVIYKRYSGYSIFHESTCMNMLPWLYFVSGEEAGIWGGKS